MLIGNIYLFLPIVNAGLFGSLFNKENDEPVAVERPKGGLFSSLDSTPWMSKVKDQRPLELPKIQLRNGKRPVYRVCIKKFRTILKGQWLFLRFSRWAL